MSQPNYAESDHKYGYAYEHRFQYPGSTNTAGIIRTHAPHPIHKTDEAVALTKAFGTVVVDVLKRPLNQEDRTLIQKALAEGISERIAEVYGAPRSEAAGVAASEPAAKKRRTD